MIASQGVSLAEVVARTVAADSGIQALTMTRVRKNAPSKGDCVSLTGSAQQYRRVGTNAPQEGDCDLSLSL